jgi:hypothetical protein
MYDMSGSFDCVDLGKQAEVSRRAYASGACGAIVIAVRIFGKQVVRAHWLSN